MAARPPQIAVAGAGHCDERTAGMARRLGVLLGRAGAVVLCGGGQGVMSAVAEGAHSVGGPTVGILPGTGPEASPPCPGLDVHVYTGVGQARNLALALSGQVLVAVSGGWGTLSEIALARKHGRPVVLLESWGLREDAVPSPSGLLRATTPEEAAELALAACDLPGTAAGRLAGLEDRDA